MPCRLNISVYNIFPGKILVAKKQEQSGPQKAKLFVVQQHRAESKAKDQKLTARYRKRFDAWKRKLIADKRRKLAQLRASEPAKARKQQQQQQQQQELSRSPGGMGRSFMSDIMLSAEVVSSRFAL